MNRFVLAVALCGLAASAAPAAAQQAPQQAYTAPSPAPNQFTDPAMSFTAPAGYYKANMPQHDPTDFDQPTVVAAFRNRTYIITIQMESFTGSLHDFEMVTENELRNQIDGVFVKKKEVTTLSNGMPAYWQEITMGSGFNTAKRFEYAWVDGVRGVVLSVSGRYGELNEDQAKQALAMASATAYPSNRY